MIRTPVTTIVAAISSATTGSSQSHPVTLTSARPTSTPIDVYASVRRCAASPSSAGDDVSRARRKSQLETARFAALAMPMTTMPMPRFSSSGPWISARIAAKAITAEPARISTPSAAAAAFSNFSWP